MRLFARLRSWLMSMVKRGRLETAVEEELRFHIESYAEDLVRSGVPQEEAMRKARIEFGGIESHKDAIRASLGLRWWDELWIDLRYSARRLHQSPVFALTAVLVLAIGIGVNVTAFSFFNMALLKLMPVRQPDSLVRLQRRSPENITPVMPYPSVVFYREHSRTLSAIMAMMGARMELESDVQPVGADFVTTNYFTELGSSAACGRLFAPARDDASDSGSGASEQIHPSLAGSSVSTKRRRRLLVSRLIHSRVSAANTRTSGCRWPSSRTSWKAARC
jgi:hypothetical protein